MGPENQCPIWGTPANTLKGDKRDGYYIDSPRAGGRYFILRTAEINLRSADEGEKISLVDWLIEQRRLGIETPEVLADTLEKACKKRAYSVHERADNLLRYLEHKTALLGDVVKFLALDNSATPETASELFAWTSSTTISEIITLAEYCDEQNWIRLDHRENAGSIGNTRYQVMLIPSGYARLAELERVNSDSSKCFVAMWFDGSVTEAFDKGIEPAIRDSGYEAIIINKVEHINKIDDRIISEIRRARFVVADFTSERGSPRGGVYYEAGFAHGLNIPVIWTCREDLIDQVHFDTRQYNHITWKTPEELRDKLSVRISAVIGDGPLK